MLLSPTTSVLLPSWKGGSNEVVSTGLEPNQFSEEAPQKLTIGSSQKDTGDGTAHVHHQGANNSLFHSGFGPAGPGKRDSKIVRAIEG